MTVATPVTFALRQVISSKVISPENVTSPVNTDGEVTLIDFTVISSLSKL